MSVAEGGLVGREDLEASLAEIHLEPPRELMDAVWARFGAPNEKVLIWKILSRLPAPRAGMQLTHSFCSMIRVLFLPTALRPQYLLQAVLD